jgi:DNA-binding MarR family transcriptional regulator
MKGKLRLLTLDVHRVNKLEQRQPFWQPFSLSMTDISAPKTDRDETTLMLGVLSVVENDAKVTQRGLSSELGIALGLTNAVLKRCVRKGLIKIANAPLNRFAYYLTPSGFAEKSRLTAEYLRLSFDLFRDARRQYGELFALAARRGRTRILLVGASELAEAAMLSAREASVEISGIVDASRAGENFLGLIVAADPAAFSGRTDAFVICDMRDPLASHAAALAAAAASGLSTEDILAPPLLRLGKGVAR